jgi:hypothetical protein
MEIYTGIEYFADLLAIPEDNFRIATSFYSGDGRSLVYPDHWSTKACTGSGLGINESNWSAFFPSGSINFWGGQQLVLFKNDDPNNKDLSLNGSSIFVSAERLGSEDTILLSSLGGQYPFFSGFCLGINQANKLYFKYWNSVERSPYTFIYNKIISDKNLFFLSREESTISMGRFNSNTMEFDIEQFDLFKNEFIESDDLYLGGYYSDFGPILAQDFPGWAFSGSCNFSGSVDKLYFIYDFPKFYLNDIGKSMFLNPSGVDGYSEINCYTTGNIVDSGYFTTGVTGIYPSGYTIQETAITGYRSLLSGWVEYGFTGYYSAVVGSYYDQCGDQYDITQTFPGSGFITGFDAIKLPLTGFIYRTGSIDISLTGQIWNPTGVWVTGEICDDVFIPTGETQFKIDYDYLRSISFKEISMIDRSLSNLASGDLRIYTEPNQFEELVFNKTASYVSNNIFRI